MNADLKAQAEALLVPCGLHDYCLDTVGCNCPQGDPRPVVSQLLLEVERSEDVVKELLHQLATNERYVMKAVQDINERDAKLAELDAANADLAGRLQTAEEQLAAATLEGLQP